MAILSIVKKTDYFSQQVRMTKATAQFKFQQYHWKLLEKTESSFQMNI